MTLRRTLILAVLSTAGFIPASLRGQSVETPRNFQAFQDGRDIVVRWSAAGDADLYIGEIDGDPQFRNPRRWTVQDDGQSRFERRLRDLDTGTYYLRVRALESFIVIKRQSDWSHVERVVLGRDDGRGWDRDRVDRDGDGWPDDWPDRDSDGRPDFPDDRRDFPRSGDFPRRLDARAFGDDLRVVWSPVRGADWYVLQLDTDRRFRDPFVFEVEAFDDERTQEFVIRNLQRDRWYLRVRAVDSFVSRDRARWSEIEVVDVEFGDRAGVDRDGRVFGREGDLRDGRGRVLRRDSRGHPVFDEHPGRGRGKGHLKHEGKKDNRGHEGDWDRDEDDDD